MTPYYTDDQVTLWHGDSMQVLTVLPAESVNCCVTSPPYYGLRDYGNEGQYGLEPTPAAYVETMRALFAEVRRVLAKDGTLWLNIGDSYQSTGGKTGVGPNAKVGSTIRQEIGRTRPVSNLPDKNLLGIPWRVAFALQDDGWILRNAIVWAKPNAMPESVADRLSSKHELIFLFSRSRKYWFDLDPIRVDPKDSRNEVKADRKYAQLQGGTNSINETGWRVAPANPGDVWEIPTTPFPGAHFAVFPPEIPRRAILDGCKPGGTVLDPFSGSGTTGLIAGKLGRRYVGIDLSATYLDLSIRTRLAQTALLDDDVTA